MSITTTYQRAFNTKRLDPYPMEILKRIDRPTTIVKEDEVYLPIQGWPPARRAYAPEGKEEKAFDVVEWPCPVK